MPELPEVEVIRRDLAGQVTGRVITAVAAADTPNARRVLRREAAPEALAAALVGARIGSVGRRGKFLQIRLDEDRVLVVHLGMSGRLQHCPAGEPPRPHTHVVLTLDDASEIRFVDPRTFGLLFVTTAAMPELAHIGPDPLGLSRAGLARLLSGHHMKIKALLMDQRCVAGIGNIYSDEMLFLARVHPFRPCDALSPAELGRLHRAIPAVLEAAINHRGTSAEDGQYRDLYGEVGRHRVYLAVYQREGQPCLRCGTPIQRASWTNRSTHFCPRCQV